MSRSNRPTPAMCEDADEEGEVLEGTYRYARSNVHSTPGSPIKQQMNTGKKKSSRSTSTSPNAYNVNDSDSTTHPSSSRRDSKMKARDEPERRPSTSKKAVVVKRPAARSTKTTPAPSSRDSDESSYYGIPSQTVASSTTRPRAHTARPQSYYGQSSRPPLSNSAWYTQAPAPFTPIVGSYPLPHGWAPPPQNMLPQAIIPPMMASSPVDHFSHRPDSLAARFGRPDRPQSSMGFRDSVYDTHEPVQQLDRSIKRRTSLSRRQKEDDDRARMPPPPPSRPQSARPTSERLVFRPPPSKQVGFQDEDLVGAGHLYQPSSRRTSVEYGLTRGPSFDNSDFYDGAYALEPASRSNRRKSQNYGLEEKIISAHQYQEDVTGGPTAPLTAESLRRVKNGGSSRSTRSSASRDESSYRQSATTRTTRSGSDDEITIKLPNGGIVEVGSAKINCKEGGEINIGRAGSGSRMGSERGGTTVYGDERKNRADRPPTRTRASSQSGSYSRTPYPSYPQYGPPHHAYAPPPDYRSLPVNEYGYPDYDRI